MEVRFLSWIRSKLTLSFNEKCMEKQYLDYRNKQVQKNVRHFAQFLVFAGILLSLCVKDLQSAIFTLGSVLLLALNEFNHDFCQYFDWIGSITCGICYSIDHYTLSPVVFQTHVRAYIYVSIIFSICVIASSSWVRSATAFGTSVLFLISNLKIHFKTLTDEYYVIILITFVLITMTCFKVEAFNR